MNVKTRIAIERKIVRKTVKALLSAGYFLNILEDGGYRMNNTNNESAIMAELMATDEDRLTVHFDGMKGWVFFVYGNDGPDVICDYTVNLESIIGPICDYAETLA